MWPLQALYGMTDRITILIVLAIGIIMGCCIMSIISIICEEDMPAYKQGQVDAVTGRMRFELRMMPDGTITWQPKRYDRRINDI